MTTQRRTLDSKYVIINLEFILEIEYNEGGMRYSPSSLRRSVDGSKFIFEYRGEQPYWIFQRITKDLIGLPEYSHDEMVNILKNPEWSD